MSLAKTDITGLRTFSNEISFGVLFFSSSKTASVRDVFEIIAQLCGHLEEPGTHMRGSCDIARNPGKEMNKYKQPRSTSHQGKKPKIEKFLFILLSSTVVLGRQPTAFLVHSCDYPNKTDNKHDTLILIKNFNWNEPHYGLHESLSTPVITLQ